MPELLRTSIPGLPEPRKGKVREVYDLGEELLIVATDRISAFDAVMQNGIPDKGAILTQMSRFWFKELADLGPDHVVSFDEAEIQARLPQPEPELARRSMIARKAEPLTIECVVRGYLTGSLYKEYVVEGGRVHGLDLPTDLRDGDRLPQPIFTPATKAETGHDENISFEQAVSMVGYETAEHVRDRTLALYARAEAYARARGIILADTKVEFGRTADGIILIDEVLTPDSSRFWDAGRWLPGGAQASFDKQFVRDFLETSGWDKRPPGPKLPEDIVQRTRARYVEAFERLTGQGWG
ncbi:phosphoribosylaminoimidazolesuccinocarboxamide synthase [bacterium]|nr:MAG: phosphoribosylaminoimidazolesuccinocarboxamide synthase [bacterium]